MTKYDMERHRLLILLICAILFVTGMLFGTLYSVRRPITESEMASIKQWNRDGLLPDATLFRLCRGGLDKSDYDYIKQSVNQEKLYLSLKAKQ